MFEVQRGSQCNWSTVSKAGWMEELAEPGPHGILVGNGVLWS
jgi:hypothetical protein